jgi:hypothetical protein
MWPVGRRQEGLSTMADRTLQTGFTRRQFLEFGAATAAAVGVTVASGEEFLSSAAAATVPPKLRV